MEGIDIKVDRVGTLKDIALIRVSGYVDTATSPELHKSLSKVIQEGISQFIIDLGAVQYVSSAGWGVFVGEIRGLREKGGDLKLIQLTPEVLEVFDMLEFNRILTCYDSLEEAIDDFDFSRGIDLTSTRNILTSEVRKVQQENEWQGGSVLESAAPVQTVEREPDFQSAKHPPYSRPRAMDDADLPLTEKIKKLVLENPMMGIWSIKRLLYSPRFGYTKIGYFKLRSIMKRLNLETRAKRYRYFRSR